MSLVVMDKSAQFSNDLPVFGHVVSESSLQLGVRVSSPRNCIDLSSHDYVLATVGSPTYTSQGTIFDNTNYIETNQIISDSSFTNISCFKADVNQSGQSLSCGISGDFETGYGGNGLYIHQETVGSDIRVSVRSVNFRINKSDGTKIPTYPQIVIHQAPNAILTTGWLYVVITHNHTTGLLTIRILNQNLSSTMQVDLNTYDISAPKRNGTWQQKTYKVGRIVTNTSGLAKVTLAEHLYHNRVLSDAEIDEQYQKSKIFLQNARGIDVSGWV